MKAALRRALAGALLAPLAGVAAAAPGDAADPIGQLLRERAREIARLEVAAEPARAASAALPGALAASAQAAADPAPPASMIERVRDGASSLVMEAMGFIGVRYRRGGNDATSGFDCSGFVRHVYNATLGIALPRRADEQAHSRHLATIQRQDLQPGDLVFFNTLRRSFSHVGIYIGDNRFIHSPRSGEEVRTESMSTAYWQRRYDGARRVVGAALGTVAQAPAALLDPGQPDARP